LENVYEQPGTPSRTVTVIDQHDLGRVIAAIAHARAQADIVVGCFHWGVHFTHDLAMYQPDVAYAAIDAGADLVLGTHPHCLQAVDVYNDKPIFYSLGNFAFEQNTLSRTGVGEYLSFYGLSMDDTLRQHPHPRHCRLTVVTTITFEGRSVVEARLTPAYFNDTAQPEPLEAGTPWHDEVMGLLVDLSAEIGTSIVRDGNDGVVQLEKVTPLDTRTWVRDRAMSYPRLGQLLALMPATSTAVRPAS
jgi:poly-gamma-glutamate synthesis protein (capsule biosynthesis protein)